jgi:riboflavin kinase/FMN adenylyltransferase
MLYRSTSELQQCHLGGALAIGNFDGLHVGHQELIKNTRLIALERRIPSGVLTFHPHPAEVLRKRVGHYLLMPIEERVAGLLALGVDFVMVQEFSLEFAQITAEGFVKNILVDGLQVQHVLVGYNFHFGYRGLGDSETLYWLGKKYGFSSMQLNEICYNGHTVSSTTMRYR